GREHGGVLLDRAGVLLEVVGVAAQLRDEPALDEAIVLEPLAELPEPLLAVLLKQNVRPVVVHAVLFRAVRVAIGRALAADELGAGLVGVLLQPVGVDQPRGVVIRVLPDRGAKCRFFGHEVLRAGLCQSRSNSSTFRAGSVSARNVSRKVPKGMTSRASSPSRSGDSA